MIKNITKLCIVFNIIFFLSFDILAKNKETYELLDLFGQIFDEVQKNYVEKDVREYMKWDSINIEVNLNLGNAEHKVYTCDFTHDYININADYRN